MPARRLVIEGRVQRVGFRDWAVRAARTWGMSGWVRNLSNGSVEILAIAEDEAALDAFTDDCRQGPPTAQVTRVDVSEGDPRNVKGFTKRFTA